MACFRVLYYQVSISRHACFRAVDLLETKETKGCYIYDIGGVLGLLFQSTFVNAGNSYSVSARAPNHN